SAYTFNEGNTLVEAGDGCSLIGTLPSAQSVSTTSGLTNRFDMPNITTYSSIDIYIGGVKTSIPYSTIIKNYDFYRDSSNHLSTSTSGTKTVKLAKNSSICCMRWYDISYDTVVVINYNSQNTVIINTNDSGASITSAAPSYYFDNTTTAGTATLRVDGSYSDATGISTSVSSLSETPTSILFTVGADSATLEDATATKYLTSSYTWSDSHESTDILKYDDGAYTFYKVSADITIDYTYTSETYTATFKKQTTPNGAFNTIVDTVADIVGGSSIAAPVTNPTLEHYVFAGWYLDDGLTEEAVFPYAMNADTTFYAKFEYGYEITFNSTFSGISVDSSFTNSGGIVDSENNRLVTTGYSNASGAQVQAPFNLAGGNISSVEIGYGSETFTLTAEQAITAGSMIAAGGTVTVTNTRGANDFMKWAYTDGNAIIFLRLYDIHENISITVNQLVNETHTIYFSGVRAIASTQSGTTWNAQTGGASNTSNPKLTLPGNYVDDATGFGFQMNLDTALTPESVTITYGNKTFTRSLTSGNSAYLLCTGGTSTSQGSTSLMRFVYTAGKTFFNIRFFRITRDIKFTVNYAGVGETVTATLVDPSGAASSFLTDVNTASSGIEGKVVTINTKELLNHSDGSVRLVIGPRETMMSGITVAATDGSYSVDYYKGETFSATGYTDGFGRMNVSCTLVNGYYMYFVRFMALYKDVTITPILTSVVDEESPIAMGIEVGNTITARFSTDLTEEQEEAAYESYYFRAQIGGRTLDIEADPDENGSLVFELTEINAQCMNDTISGTFYGVKEGQADAELGSVPTGISISEYCNRVYDLYSTYTKLTTFMANMLNFGSECQKYVGYHADSLAIDSCDWAEALVGTEDPVLPDLGGAMSVYEAGYTSGSARIKNAGLNVAEKIAVFFNVYAPDGVDDLRIVVNGYEKPFEAVGGNTYRVQLLRISPSSYDNVYVAELYSGDTLLQTVRYSVNTYVARQYSNNVSAGIMKAIYNYGLAAEEYTR
ncbi:MAG: InlB B-repeat-containing protein, partial [Lachnospiraceae bacterium]|nr:InlB B-repeat-containing protein [Lachnospiraceae bacterium]